MGSPIQVNAFAEQMTGGKAPFALYSDPGSTSFATFGSSAAIRCLFSLGNVGYAVAGETLYSIAASGAISSIGTVVGTDPVIASANHKATTQVALATGSKVYVLESGALVEHPDPDLPASLVQSVDYMDGYTIFFLTDARFFISAINEMNTVNALDYATAEASPDKGLRGIVCNRELILIGETTAEIWQNTGNATFPFERLPGASGVIPQGTKAKFSPAVFDNTILWVDQFARVVRKEGNQAIRISNHMVERDIQRTHDAQRANEIEAFVYREAGHEFYQLTGPDWTYVYDAATQLWHPKASYGLTRSKYRGYMRANDKHVVGDYTTGALHQLSMSAYDESGGYLITTLRSPVMSQPGMSTIWDGVTLDMQMGVGRGSTTHSSSPNVMIRWSDDGGVTWSKQRTRPLGTSGQFNGRIKLNNLGSSDLQGRIWEVSVSAPVERCFVSMSADVRYAKPR